jgi:hypothetical protein
VRVWVFDWGISEVDRRSNAVGFGCRRAERCGLKIGLWVDSGKLPDSWILEVGFGISECEFEFGYELCMYK